MFIQATDSSSRRECTCYDSAERRVALERYLGSGAIKGVGAALASRILKRFGDDTLRILEEEPERLAEVKGISERKAREIGEQVEAKSQMQNAMIFLSQYGISLTLGIRIYNRYQDKLYTVMRENPYQMADDIDGVGFRIADEIASGWNPAGFRIPDPQRNPVRAQSGWRTGPYLPSEGDSGAESRRTSGNRSR